MHEVMKGETGGVVGGRDTRAYATRCKHRKSRHTSRIFALDFPRWKFPWLCHVLSVTPSPWAWLGSRAGVSESTWLLGMDFAPILERRPTQRIAEF